MGCGAIGGVVAASLVETGHDVVAVTTNEGIHAALADRGLKLILSDEAKAYVVRKASKGEQENHFGARPLRREVERLIEDPLSEELLKGEFQGKDTITVDVVKDDTDKVRRLDFKGSVSSTPPQPAAEPVAAGAEEAK